MEHSIAGNLVVWKGRNIWIWKRVKHRHVIGQIIARLTKEKDIIITRLMEDEENRKT